MMARSVMAVIASAITLVFQTGEGRSDRGPSVVVELVAVTSLRDVAVAVYDQEHPIIYYNPALMQNLGPNLAAFFFAHEYGHITLRHTRAGGLGLQPQSRDSLLQARELEADCFAARRLARDNRAAVQAATRFFSRLGSLRFDNEHPTGAQRAARILACLK